MSTTIQNLMAKKKQWLEEMKAQGAGALKEVFVEFFKEHPTCEGVRWTQYTPFWNDGEPCTFSVNDFNLKMQDSPPDAGDHEDGFEYDYGPRARTNPELKAAFVTVKRIEREVDNEFFHLTFGDHAQVTATRTGFEVEEYDHE